MASLWDQLFRVVTQSSTTTPTVQMVIVMGILALFLAVRLYRAGLIVAFLFLFWRALPVMHQCGKSVFSAYLVFGALAAICTIIGSLNARSDD